MKSTAEYIALLRQFKENSAEKYGIKRLGLFGSVARGEQKDDSDIDVYIEGEPQSLFTMSRLKDELQDLLECRVDIVRLRDRMNGLLKKRIEKEGIYV